MNTITLQNVNQTSIVAAFKLGERAQTPDGRQWVYVKASAATTRGKVVIPAAVTAVAATITTSTDSQGRRVYVTKASAGFTAGAFEDGWIHFDAGALSGYAGKIKSNTIDTIELFPEHALPVDADGATTAKVFTNHLIRNALVTSKVQGAVGVAQVAFAANDYGFVLTRGQGVVTSDSTLTAGTNFTTGGATAGQVVIGVTATGPFDGQNLGYTLVPNGAANKEALAFFTLS